MNRLPLLLGALGASALFSAHEARGYAASETIAGSRIASFGLDGTLTLLGSFPGSLRN